MQHEKTIIRLRGNALAAREAGQISILTGMQVNARSWRAAHVGGNLNNDANSGPFYLNFNNTASNRNANIGGQLCLYIKKYCPTCTPWLLPKHKNTIPVLVAHSEGSGTVQADKTMKTYKGLFNKIADKENLWRAYHNAMKGKKHYFEIRQAMKNPEQLIESLHQSLISGTFKNSKYKVFKRQSGGKTRVIHKLPFFPDRVLHHAICQVMEPIWMRTFIDQTYSTIPGRGVHLAVKHIKKALLNQAQTRYCLKIDINKFYPSVNHDALIQIVTKNIKDDRLNNLMEEIIRSAPGVPIGNLVSQWFGNIYLSLFDRWVKEELRCKNYYRYCDDMIFLSDKKEILWEYLEKAKAYLRENLKLEIKSNYQVFPVADRGIDFLGYRFFPGYTLIRKSILTAMKRKRDNDKSMASYFGWITHADSYRLRHKYFKNKAYAV
jgi:RNA-directed DNA polymerase